MEQVYLLTGRPGTGKTSLIKKAAAKMGNSAGGFYTEEIRSGGARLGFRLVTLDGEAAVLEPTLAILDETDSGLDIALRIVAEGVNALRSPERGFLVITHYQRLLDYIVPDFVHVLVDGRIVRSGDKKLALHLEEYGYAWAGDREPAGATAK